MGEAEAGAFETDAVESDAPESDEDATTDPSRDVTASDDDATTDFTGRRTRWIVAGVLGAVVLAVVAVVGGEGLRAWLVAAEDDDPPPWSEEDATLDGVDLATLHAELLPAAFVASQSPGPEADAHLAAVREALAGRPDLHDRIDALFAARSSQPIADALAAESEGIAAWNQALADAGRPWALQLPLNPQSRAASLYALSYWIAADFVVPVGALDVPVRFASRVDGLNVVEAYMGHANARDEMAFIVVDRIAATAANDIWPLLDPDATGDLTERERAFAEAVRAEIAATIDDRSLQILEDTAAHRRALIDVSRALDERVARCGARFSLARIPLRGIAAADLREWRTFAQPAGGRGCPDLTFDEVDRLEEASAALRRVPGLRPAVRALTAAMTRPIVVHEAQHVADFIAAQTCTGCPDWLGESGANELSAYASTIASGTLPATSMFSACALLEGRDSASRRAVLALTHAVLDDGCDGGPGPDLVERAATAQRRWFGLRAAPELPEGYPSAVATRWF